MKQDIENIKNTLTVGLVLAAASELLIRTSVSTLENAGARFNGEAKRAMTNFIDSTHKVQYWYDRLQECVVGSNKDSMEVFDNLLYNACRLAQMGMMYYNIFSSENRTAREDIEQAFRVLEKLSLKSTGGCFTQDYINQFNPKV